MATEQPIDYNAVLEDLKAQRAKLDAGIAGIEAMLGLRGVDAAQTTNAGAASNGKTDALAPGAFLGMTIVDATEKLLKQTRKTLRNEEILAALKQGGLVFTSVNPVNTVGSILHRNWTQGGEIVRVSRGVWGLAEWHPRLRRKPGAAEPDDANDLA